MQVLGRGSNISTPLSAQICIDGEVDSLDWKADSGDGQLGVSAVLRSRERSCSSTGRSDIYTHPQSIFVNHPQRREHVYSWAGRLLRVAII